MNQDQRIDAALQAEAERAASIGSWSWNIATGEVFWSDNIYRILGYAPGEIVPSLELWGQVIHPQDVERVREMTRVAQRTGETPSMEYRILTPTGAVKYLLAHGSSVTDEAGDVVCQVGTVVDLTERVEREAALRRSEAFFAETQSMARVGAWEWRPSTGYLYYSEQLREIFGMSPEEEPDIMLFEALVHPEDQARGAGVEGRSHSHWSVPPGGLQAAVGRRACAAHSHPGPRPHRARRGPLPYGRHRGRHRARSARGSVAPCPDHGVDGTACQRHRP